MLYIDLKLLDAEFGLFFGQAVRRRRQDKFMFFKFCCVFTSKINHKDNTKSPDNQISTLCTFLIRIKLYKHITESCSGPIHSGDSTSIRYFRHLQICYCYRNELFNKFYTRKLCYAGWNGSVFWWTYASSTVIILLWLRYYFDFSKSLL